MRAKSSKLASMAGIFVNYRRNDAPGVAGRLADRLAQRFARKDIFMDVDTMKPGLDFAKQIDAQVSHCDVLLAVIGPSWLEAVDDKGRRKLEQPGDYVRVELAAALKRDIPIIPVLVHGAVMPSEDELPDDIKLLCRRHAMELRHTRFTADCEALIHALNSIMPRRMTWPKMAAAVFGAAIIVTGLSWVAMQQHVMPRLSETSSGKEKTPKAIPANPVSSDSTAETIQGSSRDARALAAPDVSRPMANPDDGNASSKSPVGAPALGHADQQNLAATATTDEPYAFNKGNPVEPAANAVGSNTRDRLALVIGNAKYPDADRPLAEPVNDARALADQLRLTGFDVELGENLSGDGMRRALSRLYAKTKRGSAALLFFSGYGIQSSRQSYLLPVDAQIWTESDARRDGISLEGVLSGLNDRGAAVKIALIDASRRNPFERRFRSFTAGLAPTIAPAGSIVMYSAALSSVISDSANDHGLFVEKLLQEIKVPGPTAEDALGRVRVAVTRASSSEQVPWLSSSLSDDFFFARPTSANGK